MCNLHVWRHLVEVLVAVLLDVGIGVNGQLLVGIHGDEHLANVGLQGERSEIKMVIKLGVRNEGLHSSSSSS